MAMEFKFGNGGMDITGEQIPKCVQNIKDAMDGLEDGLFVDTKELSGMLKKNPSTLRTTISDYLPLFRPNRIKLLGRSCFYYGNEMTVQEFKKANPKLIST